MRITVLGTMGVGKSTLGKQLAEALNLDFHPEPYEENEFLEEAYATGCCALETQLRFAQLFSYHSFRRGVLDGSILSSKYVFAPTLLSGSRLRLYERFSESSLTFVQPDLYVCLRADTDTLIQRIRARGRDMESSVDVPFVSQLNQRMNNLFDDMWQHKLVLDWNEFQPIEQVVELVNDALRSS